MYATCVIVKNGGSGHVIMIKLVTRYDDKVY